jgi:uncharacterized protein
MKKITYIIFVALLSGPLAVLSQNARVAGSWAGKLDLGAAKLRLGLNFKDTSGVLTTTLDSPDQGAFGIKMDKTTLSGDSLKVESTAMRAIYKASLLPGDSLLSGKWIQGGQTFDLLMRRAEKTVALRRPQEPKPPFPYQVKEVKFINQKAGFELAGTLTIPEGKGPFPAVVLITGSGPQNRDEELMGHKPFLVIADYLSRNGIAVLRYDDRGVGKSQGHFGKATTFDFADDAEAAFAFLVKQESIDKKHAGLAGHSEGGLIAPIVAARNKEVNFIILLAGTGVDGEEILKVQTAKLMEGAGDKPGKIAEALKLNAGIYSIVEHEPDSAKAMKFMTAAVEAAVKSDTSIVASQKDSYVQQITAGLPVMTLPWMRTFLVLDPKIYLRKVKCSVLSLNGSKDLQVPCEMNQQAIEKALQEGQNKDFKILKLDGLNHLFQHCRTGMPSEYATIEETFAPEALRAMKDWILKK